MGSVSRAVDNKWLKQHNSVNLVSRMVIKMMLQPKGLKEKGSVDEQCPGLAFELRCKCLWILPLTSPSPAHEICFQFGIIDIWIWKGPENKLGQFLVLHMGKTSDPAKVWLFCCVWFNAVCSRADFQELIGYPFSIMWLLWNLPLPLNAFSSFPVLQKLWRVTLLNQTKFTVLKSDWVS